MKSDLHVAYLTSTSHKAKLIFFTMPLIQWYLNLFIILHVSTYSDPLDSDDAEGFIDSIAARWPSSASITEFGVFVWWLTLYVVIEFCLWLLLLDELGDRCILVEDKGVVYLTRG